MAKRLVVVLMVMFVSSAGKVEGLVLRLLLCLGVKVGLKKIGESEGLNLFKRNPSAIILEN